MCQVKATILHVFNVLTRISLLNLYVIGVMMTQEGYRDLHHVLQLGRFQHTYHAATGYCTVGTIFTFFNFTTDYIHVLHV